MSCGLYLRHILQYNHWVHIFDQLACTRIGVRECGKDEKRF